MSAQCESAREISLASARDGARGCVLLRLTCCAFGCCEMMAGWLDGWMAGWLDGWLARWLDGWMA